MSSDELARKVLRLDELRVRRCELPIDSAEREARWALASLRGRLVELSARGASATLTAAFELVSEAQAQAEPVAWIALGGSTFYPPDVVECGVDLAALVVVRALDVMTAARAAERLLRSGAFGLVVLDLERGTAAHGAELVMPMPIQGRLVTLAQTHDAAVVCLTEKSEEAASLGSLVSLRTEALRRREENGGGGGGGGEYRVTLRAIKDKRRGPGWMQVVKRRGPVGMG